MNKNTLTLILILTSNVVNASVAFNGKITKELKDGSIIKYTNHGDEHFNWIKSDDEEYIIYNKKSKQYEYLTLDEDNNIVPSNIKYNKKSYAREFNVDGAQNSPKRKKINKNDLIKEWKKRRNENLK